MSEYNFEIGLKMSLTINENNDDKMLITLVGWDERVFLLAKNPLLKSMKLTSSDDCVIRYVKDGIAYGFKTNMLSMQYSPLPMIFFKYPDNIKSMPFRKSKRVKTNIPARLLKKEEGNQFTTLDARLIDLSETGCLVEASSDGVKEGLDKNDTFFVNFKIFDRSIELDCIVKNIRQIDDTIHFGSEFVTISEGIRETIGSFISMIDSHAALES